MTFAIITHVPHRIEQNHYFAYGPYVREMNVWGKHVEDLIIVAPKSDSEKIAIDSQYEHENIDFVVIDSVDVLSLKSAFITVYKIPKISMKIYRAMKKADHIHLRCPGNIGLIGCFVQILFPQKNKTAKYAGNWDPKSKQPLSYQLQKWILSNTFLTRNMQVLVYGKLEGSSKNIKPFFTASYNEVDKIPLVQKGLKGKIGFLFVGALVKGKNPLYSIQLVELLQKKGYNACLGLYGEGVERNRLEEYIEVNKLESSIILKGNQSKEMIQKAYQQSHFVVLPSASEGWPKAIAEGMFYGCVPLATAVSCVPFMLDYGNRGILLEMNLEKDVLQMEAILNDELVFDTLQEKALAWSRKYTVDVFEEEIKKLLQS
jgi:glycosyltransferase involved in cell wall biosynthesis